MSGVGGALDLGGVPGALERRAPSFLLALCLYVAGGAHLAVGLDHSTPGSLFGFLAIGAGALQWIIGIAVILAPARSVFLAASLTSFVFIELYVLNVTVGLPPLIAHTHQTGTHLLFGFPLSLTNEIEALGIAAKGAEGAAIVFATLADRTATE